MDDDDDDDIGEHDGAECPCVVCKAFPEVKTAAMKEDR